MRDYDLERASKAAFARYLESADRSRHLGEPSAKPTGADSGKRIPDGGRASGHHEKGSDLLGTSGRSASMFLTHRVTLPTTHRAAVRELRCKQCRGELRATRAKGYRWILCDRCNIASVAPSALNTLIDDLLGDPQCR